MVVCYSSKCTLTNTRFDKHPKKGEINCLQYLTRTIKRVINLIDKIKDNFYEIAYKQMSVEVLWVKSEKMLGITDLHSGF